MAVRIRLSVRRARTSRHTDAPSSAVMRMRCGVAGRCIRVASHCASQVTNSNSRPRWKGLRVPRCVCRCCCCCCCSPCLTSFCICSSAVIDCVCSLFVCFCLWMRKRQSVVEGAASGSGRVAESGGAAAASQQPDPAEEFADVMAARAVPTWNEATALTATSS